MALKLDINDDTLIPSQAFQRWAADVLTERGMQTSGKNILTGLFKRNKDLQKKLKELKTKIDRCPAGSDVWFSKMFLWPFGGKVTDDAESYFKELGNNGHLDTLETAATTAITLRQTNGTQLAAACAAAIAVVGDGATSLPAVVGKLAVALTTTAPPPPPPPPGGGGTLASLKTKLLADPSLFSLFSPALQAGNIPSMRGDRILTGINAARLIPASKAKLDRVLTAAGYNPAAMPATLTEQLEYSGMSELVESGKITLEDYNRLSNRLLRTPLNEGPTPEAAAAIAANKAKFGGFASSISANCVTLAAEIKGLQTLGQNLAKQTMVESPQAQVLKAHIKKRILQETAGKDSREQLNEFFLIAALLAALTGAIAWATSKIADFFKGSEFNHGPATYPPRGTAEAAAKDVQALGSSLIAGYGPDGMLVDAAGKRVAGKIEGKQTVLAQLDFSIKNIVTTLALLKQIKTEASTPTTPPPATALTPAAALAVYLGVAATETAKITEVQTALTALVPYEATDAGPIGVEIGKVKAALAKV